MDNICNIILLDNLFKKMDQDSIMRENEELYILLYFQFYIYKSIIFLYRCFYKIGGSL